MLSSLDWKLTLVTNHQVSLQCPTAEYPCSTQPQSFLTLPNCKVSLQSSTTKYPRSAQPQSIPAVPNCKVSLQCPTAEYRCSAQLQSIPAVSSHQISGHCRVSILLQHTCSSARKTVEAGQGNVTLLVQ